MVPLRLVLNMDTLVWSVVTTVEGRVPLASEGLSLVASTYKGENFIVSFGGYNGHYSNEVYVLKPSHIVDLQSRMKDGREPDSNAAIISTADASREMEPGFEDSTKIKELVVDNGDSKQARTKNEETIGQLLGVLKAEKEELESTLNKELLQTFQLKEELAEAGSNNTEVTSELQSIRGQLAAEQSRCFKLLVDVAELRQKLQALETLAKEVELLRRQKAASELGVKERRQSSGGVWAWIAGSSPADN